MMPFFGSQWKVAKRKADEERVRYARKRAAALAVVALAGLAHDGALPEPPAPAAPLTSDIIKVPSAEEMKKGAKIEVIKPEDAAKAQNSAK